jgi:excisionase family DNA binding protein
MSGQAIPLPDSLFEAIAARAAELVAADLTAGETHPYMTVDQAAEYLACKPKRIYDLCSQRRVPFRKDGNRTLLRREDLDAYLEEVARV